MAAPARNVQSHTGAALAMSILEGAAKLLSEMATFAGAGVSNKE
jgi:NaMN:DMB phosphoribosyltransferase